MEVIYNHVGVRRALIYVTNRMYSNLHLLEYFHFFAISAVN